MQRVLSKEHLHSFNKTTKKTRLRQAMLRSNLLSFLSASPPPPKTSSSEMPQTAHPSTSAKASRTQRFALAFLLLLLLFIGLLSSLFSTLAVENLSTQQALHLWPRAEALWTEVLARHVDQHGLVDYKSLAKQSTPLRRYLGILAQISPDTHPSLFPTHNHQLAYWINAYNAGILLNKLRFPNWHDLNSDLRKARFFLLSSLTLGQKKYSFDALEHQVIRTRFLEPRIHFALNCASLGCPQLPQKPFQPNHLKTQLALETQRFLLRKQNLHIDHHKKIIFLSSLFSWYKKDFLSWMALHKKQHPTSRPYALTDPLLGYLLLHHPTPAYIPQKGYKIKYLPYNWRLNQQNTHDPNAPMPSRGGI